MKVILLEDYSVQNVSDGYARNFLLPRGLALVATEKAIAAATKKAELKKVELDQRRAEMQVMADKLAAQEIEIKVDAGEEGKLFGSVTSADIAKAVQQAAGIEIDKRKILLEAPIKSIGEYRVQVKLISKVTASLTIKVSAK